MKAVQLKNTHAKTFPGANHSDRRVNQRTGFSPITLQFMGVSTGLVFLVLGATLQAQSGQDGRFGVPESGATAEIQKDNGIPTSSEGFSFDGRVMSTEAAGNAADLPADVDIQPLSFRHAAVFEEPCPTGSLCAGQFSTSKEWSPSIDSRNESLADGDKLHEDSTPRAPVVAQHGKPTDFNRSIYYKNKLEFGLEVGWLPINIPFVYDVFVGDSYNMTPLKYTLVPIIASLRWQTGNVAGPWILRGNFDLSFSGSVTAIPRGPETRYYSFIFGIRRNFVPHHGRIAPYFDQRGGVGNIDAKEPLGVPWAQGQNLTFTYNMGCGVRYNLNPHYSFSAGMNYMHVSNGYLSEPKYTNYGINVYGPMFGIDVRLGKPHRDTAQ
jgi:hypothetical protein